MIPVTATDAELGTYVRNIVSAVRSATPEQVARGQQWYPVAHDLAGIIGDGDVRQGAGILAALSVCKRWNDNVQLAEDAASGHVHGHTGAVLDKVRALLAGADPEDVLPMALKTGHFFRCISDPSDPDPVVIDRHAHDVAVGRRYENENRGLSSRNRYATLALAYRLAARQLGQIPSVIQATAWCVQTGQNNEGNE